MDQLVERIEKPYGSGTQQSGPCHRPAGRPPSDYDTLWTLSDGPRIRP